jgi:hypothetical protein
VKKLAWFSVSVVLAGVLFGCSGGGDKPAAEDDQFQKDLAAAAAKNKDKAPVKKNAGIKMPDATSKPDSAAAGSAPAPGK